MAWQTLTEADVLKQISGAELEALRSVVLGGGQPDPVDPVIADITSEVRGYVAASGADLDDDTSKIPDRLVRSAVAKVIIEIMTRAGGTMIDPEGARQKAATAATRLLGRVADGKFSIDDPDTGAESTGGGVSVVNQRTTRVNRTNLKGM